MLAAIASVVLVAQIGVVASVAVVDSVYISALAGEQPRVDAYPRLAYPTLPPIAQTLGVG